MRTTSQFRVASPSVHSTAWSWVLCFVLVLLMPIDRPTTQSRGGPAQAVNSSPEPAMDAILALFDVYQAVGINSAHQLKDVDDFILAMVRHPQFADVVNDIVVECGNALYQPVLDRYVAGEDVAIADAQQVWRNTTQPMCSVSPFYAQFFPLVRRINQTRPATKRLRIIAADPPIDWKSINNAAQVDAFLARRDEHIALVMEKEVLAKKRKALMLFGIAHLAHGAGTPDPAGAQFAIQRGAVSRFEENYPGATFVIEVDQPAFGCRAAPAAGSAGRGADPQSWPSLVRATSRGTSPKFVDAYLYLGPRDLLLREQRPASVFVDAGFMAELRRRAALTVGPNNELINPDKVQQEDAEPLLFCK
jgi:hypothetical protein